MSHIPMDDVKKIWENAPHNWQGVAEYARGGQGKKNGIADYLEIELPRVAQGMGGGFPDSPEKLYEVLNDKLKNMPEHTTAARSQFGSNS